MKLILALLCILSCALGHGKTEKFEIKNGNFTDAWQSSVFSYTKKCFRDSANNTGHGWLYFHTSDAPDSSGYQWLLLKLNSRIGVLSVTVHGRKEVPVRAHNIEILLGARLPNGMETAGTCTPTLADRLDDFIVCGRTKSDNADWIHEVKCNTSICTQYVLMRKYIRNGADKYMNFVNLQIEKAPDNMKFHACSSGDGKLKSKSTGLRSLVPGNKIIVKVCPPCQPIMTDQSNCSLLSPDGRIINYDMKKAGLGTSCFVIFHSELDIQKHGWHFQCDVRLRSGQILSGTESIGFVESSTIDLSALSCNGTHVIGIISATDGNPPQASMKCWVSTTSDTNPQILVMWSKTELRSSKDVLFRFTHNAIVNHGLLNVFCKYAPEEHTSPILNFREIKCIVLSNDEAASVSSRANADSLVKWTIGAVLMLGIIIAVPVTVYIWRRTGNSVPHGQGNSCREPSGISMKPFRAAERDPNTVYYYAEG